MSIALATIVALASAQSGVVIASNQYLSPGPAAKILLSGSTISATVISRWGDFNNGMAQRELLSIDCTGPMLADGSAPSCDLILSDGNGNNPQQLSFLDGNLYAINIARWNNAGDKIGFYGHRIVSNVQESGFFLVDYDSNTSNMSSVPVFIANTPETGDFSFGNNDSLLVYSGQGTGGYDIFGVNIPANPVQPALGVPVTSPYVISAAPESEYGAKVNDTGTKVVYTKVTSSKGATRTDIYVLDLGTGVHKQITSKANTSSNTNLHPSWAPSVVDNNQIVFSGLSNSLNANRIIYRMKADGTAKATALSNNTIASGSWMGPVWRR